MNIKSTRGAIVISAAALLFALIALALRAHAQGGSPLWTNRYSVALTNGCIGRAVAVDSNGNVFVTGESRGTNGTAPVGTDYVTIKYSSTGLPLWTNRYDGIVNHHDAPMALAVDSSGNVVVTGNSMGADNTYAYVTIKYSNAGVALWTNRYHTGDYIPRAAGLALDASGNVFVAGTSFDLVSSHYTTIKYSNAGVPLWTNRYHGPENGYDWATAVAVDSSGNVFVTGASTGIGGDHDYATIKYSNAGVPLWTNRYDGPAHAGDAANAIAMDSSGAVIVTGASDRLGDPDFAYYDYATIKYSNAGVPLWTNRYVSPYDFAYPNALAVDASGKVFVAGYEDYALLYARDFATVAYSSAGVPLWTNRYNGPANSEDAPGSIAVDGGGNVFVAGYSYGTNNNSDFTTIAYSGAGVPLWTNRFHGVVDYWDAANAVAVDGNGNVIVTGWSQTISNDIGADFVTIKYSSAGPSLAHLTIERDGSGGYFIRFYGRAGSTCHLQRATNLTGPWSNLATNTAPASGLIEYHEINPPVGAGFYRSLQP